MLADLLLDVTQAARHLADQVDQRAWLNSFLLVAGIDQAAEDYHQAAARRFDTLAEYLQAEWRKPYSLAAPAARAVARVALSTRAPRGRVREWDGARDELIATLARAAMGHQLTVDEREDARQRSRELRFGLEAVPRRLREQVLRLPSAFRSFDLDVSDVCQLVENFAQQFPHRSRRVCVVGVRTSGSYLGPLAATRLADLGFTAVTVVNMRPGYRLGPPGRARVAAILAGDGLALVIDDPPSTGAGVSTVAGQLVALGFPERSVVLLLPLFGDAADLPSGLRKYPGAFLPWADWSVHRRLAPDTVRRTLERLLDGVEVVSAEPFPLPPSRSLRGHARAGYRVVLRGQRSPVTESTILVKGVGLGYLGQHSLAVAAALRGRMPRVYGVVDGLLYREWIPDERALVGGSRPAALAMRGIADHLAARAGALAVDRDTSSRLAGRMPVWEAASNIVSRIYGRLWWASRLLVVDTVVKAVLRPERPAVIDGETDMSRWFRKEDGHTSGVVKVDGDERAFCNLDLSCYDAAFDVAAAAVHADDPALAGALRRAYEERAGEQISEERWLLYQLVTLWDLDRRGRIQPDVSTTRSSAALRAYYRSRFFADLRCPDDGPICALDVDGVLETEGLGFSALTPASARSLRALIVHGYQPVLVTGRSVADVRERCESYGLPGGVAEYGAALYDHVHGAIRILLSAEAVDELNGLRQCLSRFEDVQLDPRYGLAVRAFRVEGGRRRGLERSLVEAVLARGRVPLRIRAVHGDHQTDLVAAEVDKGSGLTALLAALGPRSRLALAVGDTVADLPALRLAPRRFAPAHAPSDLRRAGVTITARPYQTGLSQAVTALLEHQPGRCAACAPPRHDIATDQFLRLLGATEGSALRAARTSLGLLWSSRLR